MPVDTPENVRIRVATDADELAVRRVLDGAMLETGALGKRIGASDVMVAVEGLDGGDDTGDSGTDRTDDPVRVLGAVVLDDRGDRTVVDAIAVRRRRRDRGIGSALVAAASERRGTLVATFREDVRPFYASLGFAIDPADEDGRYRGRLAAEKER